MLESCISDLKSEISDTDSLEYKTMLKGRKAILIKLYETFQIPEVETAISRIN